MSSKIQMIIGIFSSIFYYITVTHSATMNMRQWPYLVLISRVLKATVNARATRVLLPAEHKPSEMKQ